MQEITKFCVCDVDGANKDDMRYFKMGQILKKNGDGTTHIIIKSEFHPETNSVDIELEKINYC